MSAQKELAELIRIARETPCLGSLQASNFIRDHGPAIAELIDAARKLVDGVPEHEPERPETCNHDDTRDWAADWESWYTANALRAPLRKLTEPKE